MVSGGCWEGLVRLSGWCRKADCRCGKAVLRVLGGCLEDVGRQS